MRLRLVLLLVFLPATFFSQNLPTGYISYLQCDFLTPQYDTNLLFSPATKTKIDKGILTIEECKSDSIQGFYPASVMLVDNNIFGEFIAEITLAPQQSAADSSGGIFIVCGLRNASNYYLVKLSDSGASFFIMYKGTVTAISFDSSFVLSFGKFVKLRIERDILQRSFVLKSQGKTVTFSDPNLVMGYVGIGTQNIPVFIDKLLIWAPTSINQKVQIF